MDGLFEILENLLTNSLSNLFLLDNAYSKEYYYSDKYANFWKGSKELKNIRKIPLTLKKILITADTVYLNLSLGIEDIPAKKSHLIVHKRENTTLFYEIEYRGIIKNILPAIQEFLEKELSESIFLYHEKFKPIIVEGEKIKEEFEKSFFFDYNNEKEETSDGNTANSEQPAADQSGATESSYSEQSAEQSSTE